MKKKGILGFFTGSRPARAARLATVSSTQPATAPSTRPVTAPSTLAVKIEPTLVGMPRDVHYLLSDRLDFADWRALQLSCRALRDRYQSEEFWRRRAANMLLLPEFVLDHPEFTQFNFNYRQLVKIFVSGGEGLKTVLRAGIAPWQLAALSGKVLELKAMYPGDKIKELKDENEYGVEDYLLMGDHREALIQWGVEYAPGFNASKDKYSKFPTLAVIVGNIPLLEFLVKQFGYDIKLFNTFTQKNLLEVAVEYGQRKMVAWLIAQGVSQTQGISLYRVASENFRWEILQDIRALGVLKFDQDRAHECLRWTALSGNVVSYKQFCSDFELDLGTYPKDDLSRFLNQVLIGGNLEMVEDILSKGVISIDTDLDGNRRYPNLDPRFDYGRTPLQVAAQYGHLQLIEDLLTQFPDKLKARAVDESGNTLIHYSAVRGVLRETHFLCDRYFDGKDLFRPNNKGETIAHLAADYGRLNYLHLLRERYGEEPLKVLDSEGNSLLHHACAKGFPTLAVWLMDTVKLSPAVKNKDGDTPLHLFAVCLHMKKTQWHNFERVAKKVDFALLTESCNLRGMNVARIVAITPGYEARLEALAPKSKTRALK